MVSAFCCENTDLRKSVLSLMIDRIEVKEITGRVFVITRLCEVGTGYWPVCPITSTVTTLGFS